MDDHVENQARNEGVEDTDGERPLEGTTCESDQGGEAKTGQHPRGGPWPLFPCHGKPDEQRHGEAMKDHRHGQGESILDRAERGAVDPGVNPKTQRRHSRCGEGRPSGQPAWRRGVGTRARHRPGLRAPAHQAADGEGGDHDAKAPPARVHPSVRNEMEKQERSQANQEETLHDTGCLVTEPFPPGQGVDRGARQEDQEGCRQTGH